ncbi:MAG: ESX-1 secretion-associated protein [Actinomycetota bacterium]|nr:ESX-1 secretion-associated protein [Actinomycetota bacterium]
MNADFGVVPDLLRTVAGLLRGSAEDLRAVRSAWDRQTVEGSAMFGTLECADAFRALQETWFHDLGTRIGYLTGLGDAAEDSATTYTRVDDTARQDFGRRGMG